MSRIVVDIDSTLYNFEQIARDAFLSIAHERGDKDVFRGAYNPWVEWRSPDDACGTDIWLDAIKLTHDPAVIAQQTPYIGSAETVQALVENGHSILYLTNRDEKVHEATAEWLRSNDFPINERLCSLTCTTLSKTPFMHDCQYIIDDRPKTLVEFVYDFTWARTYPTKPRKGFGLVYSYNRALTDVPNIWLAPTWSGLRYYLHKEGMLSGEFEGGMQMRVRAENESCT